MKKDDRRKITMLVKMMGETSERKTLVKDKNGQFYIYMPEIFGDFSFPINDIEAMRMIRSNDFKIISDDRYVLCSTNLIYLQNAN